MNFPELNKNYDSVNFCEQIAKNNNLILIYVKNRFDCYSLNASRSRLCLCVEKKRNL